MSDKVAGGAVKRRRRLKKNDAIENRQIIEHATR